MQKLVACSYKGSSSVPSWAVPTNRVGFSAFLLRRRGLETCRFLQAMFAAALQCAYEHLKQTIASQKA